MDELRPIMRRLHARSQLRIGSMVRLLGQFVRCESPSNRKDSVDRMARMVAGEWRRRDAKVRVIPQKRRGDHVRAELDLASGRSRGQILVIGHLDTVYPLGTLAKMPFRIAEGRAWGPGTFDMKAGLVLALAAIDALRSTDLRPSKRMVFFWNSDEEIGSETSRRLIEREALRSDAVLVLEPAYGAEGRVKTARKGVGTAEVVVTGRSAHAGINPTVGVNAVHELALQIARLMEMNNPLRGLTVQATVVGGGTASNVVPDRAAAQVDIRIAHSVDGPRVERKLRGLRPILKGAKVEVKGGMNRPPLERSSAVVGLFHHAQSLMAQLNLALGESSTGGGSDGNFTAAIGIPTLDGLGAVGDGAHSPREHVVIRSLPERAALIAGLLATL